MSLAMNVVVGIVMLSLLIYNVDLFGVGRRRNFGVVIFQFVGFLRQSSDYYGLTGCKNVLK